MGFNFQVFRTLVESAAFTQAYDAIRSNDRIADALSGLLWGLAKNPKEFDLVWGDKIWWAKSTDFFISDDELAYIRVFFSVRPSDEVDLMFFDLVSSDENEAAG
jgi:hypothetical protein